MLFFLLLLVIWDKVFKSGLSKFCGRQPLKNLRDMVCLSSPEIFQRLSSTNLLSPLLNTLSQMELLDGFLTGRKVANISCFS